MATSVKARCGSPRYVRGGASTPLHWRGLRTCHRSRGLTLWRHVATMDGWVARRHGARRPVEVQSRWAPAQMLPSGIHEFVALEAGAVLERRGLRHT